MSDSEQAAQAPAVADTPDKAETSADASPQQSAQDTTRPASSGRGIAIVALVLAVVALGGIAYMDWNFRPLYALTAQMENDADRVAELRDALERRIDKLEADTEITAVAAGELQTALGEEVAAIAELSQRVGGLDQRVNDMTGIDAGQRNRLLQAEATYYLRIANAQAMLARNPAVAASALRMADDRLREIGDPALAPVRRILSEELAALDALPALDTAGISFRLQSLAGQVRGWPLANPAPERFGSGLPDADSSGAAAGTAWDRLRQTVTEVFGSIVSVRQSDAPPEVQLSEAEQSLVIESVRAELQLARLTLVTGELSLYQGSVSRAAEQIRGYFDTEAAAVAAALDALAELEGAQLPGELPDISGSLSLLLGNAAPAAADTP